MIVAGSGLSGLTVATELVAAGLRDVLLIEAGSGGSVPWSTATPPHYVSTTENPLAASQRHGIGGRSRYWHGVVLRIEDYAINDPCWPATTRRLLLGNPEHTGLYAEVEDELARWSVATSELRASASRSAEADNAFIEMLIGATGLPVQSVPQAVRYSAEAPARRAFTPLERFREQGAQLDWRAGGSTKRPRIASNLTVLDVLTERGAASGVLVHDVAANQQLALHAPIVVLAAGTIENTRLVGQLRAGGEAAHYDGLNDHLTLGFVARVPIDKIPLAARAGGFALLVRSSEKRCNVFARLHDGRLADDTMLLDVWALGEQTRSPHNSVSLSRSPDAARQWSATVTAGLSDDDVAVLNGERELLSSVWSSIAGSFAIEQSTLAFTDFFTAPRSFHAARDEALSSPARAALTYAWPLGAGDHEGGTLPLGSLLGTGGVLRAIDGVFVTGPATFPRAGAANPSLTTLALARLTARTICAAPR